MMLLPGNARKKASSLYRATTEMVVLPKQGVTPKRGWPSPYHSRPTVLSQVYISGRNPWACRSIPKNERPPGTSLGPARWGSKEPPPQADPHLRTGRRRLSGRPEDRRREQGNRCRLHRRDWRYRPLLESRESLIMGTDHPYSPGVRPHQAPVRHHQARQQARALGGHRGGAGLRGGRKLERVSATRGK
jgi:hypothetical protein